MIAIVDFGGQTCHLIARRVRELGVEGEVVPYKVLSRSAQRFSKWEGIILSGGPSFVNLPESPTIDKAIFGLGVPVLGICYGMQLMGKLLGGKVGRGKAKEFGIVPVNLKKSVLFADCAGRQKVLMSHGDQVLKLPPGFVNLGSSRDVLNAAMSKDNLLAIQFHPEVTHTPNGQKILENFIFKICNEKKLINKNKWLENKIQLIKEQVGQENVICGLSGGVDSATAAAIVYKSIGKQLKCVYVDTGLMREGETEEIKKYFGKSLVVVYAQKLFLKALKGQTDPEKKRKIIGKLFISIFEKEAKKFGAKWLVQGTIYPDVIESAPTSLKLRGVSAETIKSHHNVGGLPEKMDFKLVEPLRELYKDEVRLLAAKLGLPKSLVNRQPFPGPGLAVRIRGEVTKERLNRLRQAEQILHEEAKKFKLPEGIWVTQAIYVPLQTTGVKGDGRSFDEMIAIRSLTSVDAMTADWTRLPYELLAKVSRRIVNEVPGINRVVYDITTKPPATMEWE
ncbi:MAG: Glutamine-hydrolyzing GMP synthase [Candidatus Beckwithbacteria bacterium GW2011_GWA2_43_10]|uniref:GMP synthase [glutamine-hydrolyzing] n=1 Tax=Candidatus Beckwithbacteria bacterium GW2011_GWA2_43_10 TaxID=1618369 RepID=A0A0G1C2S7_9BACT|nr:MAG: Glutamine-hydrolyzing GMP synthase [Candidatus Beckwithbacteria bacterium GW2011_GWA2_43_10]